MDRRKCFFGRAAQLEIPHPYSNGLDPRAASANTLLTQHYRAPPGYDSSTAGQLYEPSWFLPRKAIAASYQCLPPRAANRRCRAVGRDRCSDPALGDSSCPNSDLPGDDTRVIAGLALL
jgi:hypothetical protein